MFYMNEPQCNNPPTYQKRLLVLYPNQHLLVFSMHKKKTSPKANLLRSLLLLFLLLDLCWVHNVFSFPVSDPLPALKEAFEVTGKEP